MTYEPPLVLTPTHRAEIASQIGEIALATPGVLRLEPTARSALVGLRAAAAESWRTGSAAGRGPDGVTVTHVGGVVEVAVDLATQFGHPAVDVAIAVRQQVLDVLAAASITVGRIDVSVLAIGDD